jgi:trans-2-enoyl-CoA reductase
MRKRQKIYDLAQGASRSHPYRQGHRNGIKAAIAWLEREARTMNDPYARRLLFGASFSLGVAARIARETLAERDADRGARPQARNGSRRGRDEA